MMAVNDLMARTQKETRSLLTITRKELRSYFLSPVAFIFLGVFLLVTLFIFFTQARFFARDLADVRPLFNWLPLLLIFLVSAITMRQWSEEQKMGTLEVLLTLPLRTTDLVLGKFLAGFLLLTLALALTLPLPITVEMLGDLDWGPVFGGYIAALLLGSTYLSIGLCVSARTDNQIVALMVTALIGSLLYIIGADGFVGFFGNEMGELLRQLGTGSRFESIERGVLDLRDLLYYGSLTLFFLLLNIYFLEMKRLEKQPLDGNSKRPVMRLSLLLIGLNLFALNLWFSHVTSARADLTQHGEYSISEVTEGVLSRLEEPLVIRGYFSEKTHPLLSPLVPRIRDFLTEYEVMGGGHVDVKFFDPNKDEKLEEEINEQYDIKSRPFEVMDRHERSLINSYFHILIRYGKEHVVLSFDDLIEVHVDENELRVRLRNLEYDITRSIKKVMEGSQSIDSIIARTDNSPKLTAYISDKEQLPEKLQEVPERLEGVLKSLAEKSGGRFSYELLNPDKDRALAREIARKYGFKPMALDLFNQERFYFYMLFSSGDRLEPIFPQGEMSEAKLREDIEAAIKRSTPGFLKTVALLTEQPQQQQMPPMPGMRMPPQQRPDFQNLEHSFSEDFQFKRLKLDDGVVPSDVDVLIVAKPGKLDRKQQYAIDQYLMRGGALIVLSGAHKIKAGRTGINSAGKIDPSLKELLKSYGVEFEDAFVMDPKNANFPIPVRERKGPFVMERIELKPYPFFPNIRQEGFAEAHVAFSRIPNIILNWGSALKVNAGEGVESEILLKSSEDSWLYSKSDIQPDYKSHPKMGFEVPKETSSKPLAVTMVGRFESFFKDKASPLYKLKEGEKPEGAKADHTGRNLLQSPPDARLVVIGSEEFVSDLGTRVAMQMGGGLYRGNQMLIHNLVSWALEDTEMLKIRSAGAFARTLDVASEDRSTYEWGNYIVAILSLFAVLGLAFSRRLMIKPMDLS